MPHAIARHKQADAVCCLARAYLHMHASHVCAIGETADGMTWDALQGQLSARYPNGGYIITWGRSSRSSHSEPAHNQVKLHNMASQLGVSSTLEVCCRPQVAS